MWDAEREAMQAEIEKIETLKAEFVEMQVQLKRAGEDREKQKTPSLTMAWKLQH